MRTNKLLTTLAVASVVLIGGCNKETPDPNLSFGKSSVTTLAVPKPQPAPKPQPLVKGAVNLGVAGDFVILAQSAITDVSTSAITGDIGLSPAAGSYFTVTDGNLCDEVVGLIYTVVAGGPACETIDATKLGTAVLDFGTAYADAAGRAYHADAKHLNLGAGEIGGLTLAPGVYHWDNNVTISTDVTLKGGKNDVWIFQIPGTLNISSATSVILKGVLAKNIFWVVGGAVTLGTTSHFEGNILGWTGITLETGASINGRLLAGTQVALQMATVTMPPVK